MKPNTPHYVLTADNSITYGKHFYTTCNIKETCWGIYHCGIMDDAVTNTDHLNALQFLRRIFIMSLQEYENLIQSSDSCKFLLAFVCSDLMVFETRCSYSD